MFPSPVSKGVPVCSGDKFTPGQIGELLAVVEVDYRARKEKDWDLILDELTCPNDFDDDSSLKRRQKRIWQRENALLEIEEWHVESIQQCGNLAYVLAQTWQSDSGEPFKQQGGSWWIRTGSGWRQTERVFDRFWRIGRKITGASEKLGLEPPSEEFVVVYQALEPVDH